MSVRGRRAAAVIVILSVGIALFAATGAGASGEGAGPSPYALTNSPTRNVAPGVEAALLQAWEAQGQFADASTVFPPDDRIAIPDTTVAPWRDVVSLFIKKADGYFGCSGAMLGPNVVITAAHCLFDNGAYAEGVVVIPASTATTEPYGYAVSADLAVSVGWANGVGQDSAEGSVPLSPYDYGLVVLHNAPFGNALSPYFTIANVTDSYLERPGTYLATAGFPGDKPDGSMWFASSQDFIFDSTYICTTMDVYAGQSGSPIIAFDPGASQFPYVFSVVSVGDSHCNTSVRFTDPVITALNEWCAEDGCTIQSVHLDDAGTVSTQPPSPSPSPSASPSPSPSPTATPTPSPTATPAPGAHSHTVTIGAGLNIIAGPVAGDLSPAQFASCLPPDAWLAVYTWDVGGQRWLHWFAPSVPAYVNATGDTAWNVPRGAGVAILAPAGLASQQVVIPDDAAGACG